MRAKIQRFAGFFHLRICEAPGENSFSTKKDLMGSQFGFEEKQVGKYIYLKLCRNIISKIVLCSFTT